jgi:glycosyltransferase involved in cell wall biosynthesis
VVIPVVDAVSTIGAAAASALHQAYPGDLEVVVAHGPSTDGTGDLLERLGDGEPRLRIVDNPSGRTPAGLNLAIAAARNEVIVRCDAQAQLPPGYVLRAVGLLEETGADNVGGVQAAEGVTLLQRAIAIAQTTPLGVGDARYRTGGKPGPTDTVYLGVFRRAALERIGGFDETLERNQDYEANYRIRKTGGPVFFHPDLRVAYRPRGSLGRLWRQYFDYGRWKRVVLRRHPRSLRWRQLVPPAFVLGMLGSAALALTPLRWAAAAVPGAYLIALLLTTGATLARRRDPAALLLPAALPTMHLAWGTGFLAGRVPHRG